VSARSIHEEARGGTGPGYRETERLGRGMCIRRWVGGCCVPLRSHVCLVSVYDVKERLSAWCKKAVSRYMLPFFPL
jgi:hypothetical protein